MKLKVSELRGVAEKLLTYLDDTGRAEIEICEDYYWIISQEEVYDPTQEPKDLTIGQLSDDWRELSAILSGKSPPIGYALVWFSAILRNIGEKSAH